MSRHTEYGNSPVGRLISGDPWTKQTTDANNREIPPEKQSFWFAVAIEKNAPGMNEMLGLMFKAAQAGYGQAPQIMAQINMGLAATAFSWKIADGDEMRANATTGEQELRWKHGQGCWVQVFDHAANCLCKISGRRADLLRPERDQARVLRHRAVLDICQRQHGPHGRGLSEPPDRLPCRLWC